jgi:hypothetical protein
MNRVQQPVVEFLAPIARRGLFVCTAAAALLAGADVAYSGPCTAQIAALEQQIKSLPAGPKTGPTFSQTLGAQLHHQPTPEDVQHAQTVGRKEADAALKAAQNADAADNAGACNAALEQAKRLYDIDQ